ncbi:alanine--glyoxylate aminotransferase-like [Tigriopus californicus]|uniref:alanine--glyoxylate aminotransferase-like n=1 Tax=Tigriopus californicus TaxID=6832 RepID=UPI0027DA266A|nr:alanine--glyoxylate aminotransferase-like [Tigriopus californicus]XP_059085466.1 alanine--glyoxylate aminotransferase-like [Tigriopus californicus]
MSSLKVNAPEVLKESIVVPAKSLMGPGPSNSAQRVLNAMSLPTLGHLHPEFQKIMDDVKAGIQYVFQTKNALTLALSATGHAAMEAVMVNMLEKGDIVLIANNGIWGERAGDMATRAGANVKMIQKEAGGSFSLEEIKKGLEAEKPKLLFVTHGESSTGVVQNLEGLGKLCHSMGVLFAVDTVASLGGVPVAADDLEIDVIYTGSQKVLGVPPGLAPISFSPKAVETIKARKSPPQSFYLDMNWLGQYWDCYPNQARVYHHTGPVNAIYGLREGLAIAAEEGLPSLWKRHAECAQQLHKGLANLKLELFVPKADDRLPTVTTVVVPDGLDWKAVTVHAMNTYKVEIAGGLGPSAGKVWRIGLMGQNAYPEKVTLVLKALAEAIEQVRKLGGKL